VIGQFKKNNAAESIHAEGGGAMGFSVQT